MHHLPKIWLEAYLASVKGGYTTPAANADKAIVEFTKRFEYDSELAAWFPVPTT